MEDYMRSGQVKHFVPDLDITFMPEGNHFVQEQLPEQDRLPVQVLSLWTPLCCTKSISLICRTLFVDCGITNPKITAPALLIMGEKDYVMKIPGMQESIQSGKMKEVVPDLDITMISEGNHFVQEQLPEQVNELIITFLNKNSI
ncbi:hypothetical protein L1049_023838 [Liquidambar formosana]|uniref:Epoxide hydrolase n=1 Tax=Liquidambar formosana TaxID=63359 RepID=A0AAP0WZ23_LIQFO